MRRLSTSHRDTLAALLHGKGLLDAPLPPSDSTTDGPWTASQAVQRLWLQESLEGGSQVNALGLLVRLERPTPVSALLAAHAVLADRHQVLRTDYDDANETLRGTVLSSPGFVNGAALPDASPERLARALRKAPVAMRAGRSSFLHPIGAGPKCDTFLWILHHAVVDWSGAQVLLDELSQLLDGTPPDRLPPATQARHIALREQARSPERTRALQAYWQTRLAGAAMHFQPPIAQATAPARSSRDVERASLLIDAAWSDAIRARCRAIRTTPYFLFLTAFTRLLQALTLSEEQLIASTLAHRDRPGAASFAGCLSDLVPLRCAPPVDAAFIDALRALQAGCNEDLAHAELGYAGIVEAVRPPRLPGKAPLAQVMFNLLPEPAARHRLRVEPLPMSVARADLVLEILDGTAFSATFECRASLFPPGFADTLVQAWRLTVAEACEPPRTPGDAGAESGATAHRIHRACIAATEPARVDEVPVSVYRHFHARALARPNRTALIEDAHSLDYAGLLARIETFSVALAAQLPALARAPSSQPRVAIWLPRSIDLAVSLLACLRIGALPMLLDPSHPPERQARLLELSRADLLIARPGSCPAAAAGLPSLDPAMAARMETGEPDSAESQPLATDRMCAGAPGAFIAFTSGSTGTPRGVLCTHLALLNRLIWFEETFPAQVDDVACLKTSPGFVDVFAELLGPLCAGVPLVIASDTVASDPHALSALMHAQRVTRVVMVPTLLQAMLDHVEGIDTRLSHLRLCVSSGEALPTALAEAFRRRLPACELINVYGSSEVTADASFARIDGPFGRAIDIGKPLPGIALAVVDAEGRALPDGFPGELAVSGIGLAEGYLDDAESTARVFRALPAFAGERAFLTGDLALCSPDGRLLLLGRRDRQLKLEGVRIDAREIELAIEAWPGIRACRVGLSNAQLVAGFTSVGDIDESELRRHLQARLPRAALPARIRRLEHLPVGPTGKIDDRALAALCAMKAEDEGRSPHGHAASEHPVQGPIERYLAGHWASLLGVRPASRTDDFFELGGTSLKAVMAMNQARRDLGVACDARWLFETPMLGELARRLTEQGARIDARERPVLENANAIRPGTPQSREAVHSPLSFNQQWLIREHHHAPARTAYNLSIAYRFVGALDVSAMLAALQALSDRHAALRTSLVSQGDQWTQLTQPPGHPLAVAARQQAALDREAAVAHRDALARQPFSLDRGSLIRIELCPTNDDEHYLFLVAHHAMIDGWSGEILMRDLAKLYAWQTGRGPELDDRPLGIHQVAVAQQAQVAQMGARLDAYRHYLSHAVHPRFPQHAPGRARGGQVARRLAAVAPLHRTAPGSPRFAPFVAGLCVLVATLRDFSGHDGPFMIGFPESGRHRTDWEPVAGFLANTVLGRFDLGSSPDWTTALERIRQQVNEALAHQDLPAFWLQEQGWKGLDDRSDELQLMVVPEQDFDWSMTLPGLSAECLGPAPTTEARVDIALSIRKQPNGDTAFELEYDTSRVEHRLAEQLAAVFRVRLDALLDRCHESPDRSPPIEAPAGWFARQAARPAPCAAARLEELLHRQALWNPHRPVVSDDHSTLSASRLWALAGQITARLGGRIAGDSPVVALRMSRSAQWVAVLIGIWRAGATVVILDPSWPEERARFILRDAGATLLLGDDGTTLDPAVPTLPIGPWLSPRSDGGEIPGKPPEALPAAAPLVGNPTAALVYTSGSTGQPKGVPIRHDALVRLGGVLRQAFALDAQSRVLQLVAPAFDAALSDLAMSWHAGATLVTLSQHRVMPGASLLQALREHRITHMQAPAAVLGATPAEPLPALRLVAVGGETCPPATLAAWAQSRELQIVYGPTEATVTVSMLRHRPGLPPGAIGKAVAGNALAVVNERGEAVFTGMPGELLIAGPQVASGYRGHARARSGSFVTSRLFGEPLPAYRTGDRAWMSDDGEIHLLGRIDRQFKMNGQRIDPEEIEVALARHPAVRQAAIAAHPRSAEAGSRQIVAWVVTDSPPPTADTLRAWLARQLPPAWVPTRWIFLDRLPLNANGKTDWAALPVVESPAARASTASGAAPSSSAPSPTAPSPPTRPARFDDIDDIADFLQGCWATLLERDDIEHDRSFFDYGGHSMLTVTLHERLQQAFGIDIPIGEIFGHPTIEEMARYLLDRVSAASRS